MTNFSAFAVTFVVRDDRSAHYERVGSGAHSQDLVLSEEAWTRMLDELRANDVCSLRSSGVFEHEDQTPTLVIAVPGLDCRVMLSDSEWYQDPRARHVKDAVGRLFPSSPP